MLGEKHPRKGEGDASQPQAMQASDCDDVDGLSLCHCLHTPSLLKLTVCFPVETVCAYIMTTFGTFLFGSVQASIIVLFF